MIPPNTPCAYCRQPIIQEDYNWCYRIMPAEAVDWAHLDCITRESLAERLETVDYLLKELGHSWNRRADSPPFAGAPRPGI